MAWNIFKKKEESNPLEDNSLELKVDAALRNAQNDKRQAASDIEKIKSWTAEVIVETYADIFPNGNLTYYRDKYKEDAIEKYESIKSENEGKVPYEKAEKCDKIVKGYLNQIELRKSKLLLYEKLENEYAATKMKLKQLGAVKKSDAKVDSHENRLRELDNDTSSYVDAVGDSSKLDELQKEFELKSEYQNQLTLLSDKFDTQADNSYDNSLAYKDEIDKILNDLK
jgi:hypothetical protein